jgi:NADPH-dependent curcumin reductase CurA
LAAQIAKAKGCRVIGVAGGADKCRYLTATLGLDSAIDYREGPLEVSIKQHFPNGVDVFFDNVGGQVLDAVLANMARGCRIAICGAISQYDVADRDRLYGVKNLPLLLFRQARVEGFVAEFGEHNALLDQVLLDLVLKKGLQVRTHIIEGFENIPEALKLLLSGQNHGKLIARI